MQQVSVDSWFLVLIRSVLKFIVGWIHIICSILINMRCKIKERTSSLCYFVGSQQRTIKVLSLHWIADRVLKFKVCNHHLNLITLILLFAYLFLPWKLKRQAWGKEFIIFQKFSRNIKSQILWKSPKTVKISLFDLSIQPLTIFILQTTCSKIIVWIGPWLSHLILFSVYFGIFQVHCQM